MKILRTLILVDMFILMALGFGMAIYLAPSATFSKVTPFDPLTALPLLGAAMGGLAFVVATTGPFDVLQAGIPLPGMPPAGQRSPEMRWPGAPDLGRHGTCR